MQSNVFWNILPNTILRVTIRTYARKNRRLSDPRLQKQTQKTTPNPGMQKRIQLLYDKQNINKNIEEDDFDELETDFAGVGEVDKLNKHEIKALKEKEKLFIVGRKYFKENKINFLTWNDKEQIRYLYQTNPEEWTIERLSEGFPALSNTITKIIAANWKPSSDKRKKNHDKHVENNWKLLKLNKLNNLPSDLIEHIKKFTNRKLNTSTINEKIIIKQNNLVNKPGEFGSIIENYDKLVAEKNTVKETIEEDNITTGINNISQKENTLVTQQKIDGRMITLSELKKNIENRIEKHKNVDEYEKMIVKESPEKLIEDKSLIENALKIGGLQTYKVKLNNELSTEVDKKILDSLKYPEKIIIPKEKYKRGLTYKVNDCYYDDDGEFLYRVPGMY